MKLSIIIPSYNTEKLLNNCLISILKEKELSYEIIVVDNGSDYQIKEQIAKIKKNYQNFNIYLIQNKNNLGFAKACNQGIAKAQGAYLLFLNSDTLILNKAIRKAVSLMEREKNIDILGIKLLNQNKSLQPSVGYFPKLRQIFYLMFFFDDLPFLKRLLKPFHLQDKNFYQKRRQVDWVTGAFLLVRRSVIKKIGGFDEDYFMYAEEVDFCYRAKKAGFKVFYDPEIKIIHYQESSPRTLGEKAILAEYKGLKIFFKKHKPAWEMPFLRIFLKAGALLRLLIFGILLKDDERKKVYQRAWQVA